MYEFTLEPAAEDCVIGVHEMRALFRSYQGPPCAVFVEGYPLCTTGRVLTKMVELKPDDPDPYKRGLYERAIATLLERPLEIQEAWSEYEAEFADDRRELAADLERRYRTEAAI